MDIVGQIMPNANKTYFQGNGGNSSHEEQTPHQELNWKVIQT